MEPHLCRVDSALGRTRECPRELCPLWSDGACVLGGLLPDLGATRGLPELLQGLRERMGGPGSSGPDHTLLPPGLR
jgi:hypothetical protein